MPIQHKKLYRSRKNRMLSGVSGGLGDYFDVDPVIIRLAFVLLAIFGGGGIILYIIMWIIVPEEPLSGGSAGEDFGGDRGGENLNSTSSEEEGKNLLNKSNGAISGQTLIAIIILLIGFYMLVAQFLPFRFINFGTIIASIVILLGFYILFKNTKKD